MLGAAAAFAAIKAEKDVGDALHRALTALDPTYKPASEPPLARPPGPQKPGGFPAGTFTIKTKLDIHGATGCVSGVDDGTLELVDCAKPRSVALTKWTYDAKLGHLSLAKADRKGFCATGGVTISRCTDLAAPQQIWTLDPDGAIRNAYRGKDYCWGVKVDTRDPVYSVSGRTRYALITTTPCDQPPGLQQTGCAPGETNNTDQSRATSQRWVAVPAK